MEIDYYNIILYYTNYALFKFLLKLLIQGPDLNAHKVLKIVLKNCQIFPKEMHFNRNNALKKMI